MRAVAIDFETANENRTSACAIGLAWIDDGKVTGVEETLIRPPEMRFSSWNIAVHGIRPRDVEHAPLFGDLWPDLARRIDGRVIVAHNASFDMSVLRHSLALARMEPPECRFLCTVALARRVWPDLPRHRLNDVSEFLGLELDHHRAGSDAAACAEILLATLKSTETGDVDALSARTGVVPGVVGADRYTPCRGGDKRWGRAATVRRVPETTTSAPRSSPGTRRAR